MREKLKSRKKRTILIASIVIVITLIAVGICLENNKTSLTIKKVDKVDKEITKLDVNEEKEEIILEERIENKGEESATEEVKAEVSNTPKSKDNKKSNSNTNTNISNSNNQNSTTVNNNQSTQQSTIKQEEVVNNNSNSSSNSNQVQKPQTNQESTDLYNSITHGQWETDINDNESLCEAKGNRIANNELKEILDWNEQHEDELKQPIINYSRCYPVIKDGVKHWYLHFFTTKGEGMDTEIKNKYNF